MEMTIRPLSGAPVTSDFLGSYLPLTDGGVITFSGWMAQKYGLSDWVSDAALLDQATGRTALTVYGLDRTAPEVFVEGLYDFKPKLPACGLVTKVLLGEGNCKPDWHASAPDLVGTGILAPQMAGVLDFSSFNALTPADRELGRFRFGAPIPRSLACLKRRESKAIALALPPA